MTFSQKNEDESENSRNNNIKNIELINNPKDVEFHNFNVCEKDSTKQNATVIYKELNIFNHNNEYDVKAIEEKEVDLKELKEVSNDTSIYKEKNINIPNAEVDTTHARQKFQQKLNSTQSTMIIEGPLDIDNNYELISNENYEIDIFKKNDNNKRNNIDGNEIIVKNVNNNNYDDNLDGRKAEFDNSLYVSNNLDDLIASNNEFNFFCKLKMLFNYFGPGWIVAIAYLDPGNLCSNLNVGLIRSTDNNNYALKKDYTGYYLLWIMIYGHLLGFLFQVLSMKLGHATGLDLATICYKEFDKKVSFLLYIFVQIAIWGAHIQAIVGCFVALNLICNVPIKVAIFYTLFEALIYSFLENKSLKLLENMLSFMIAMLAICFFINVFMIPINMKELAISIIYPRIPKGREIDALGLLGSIISAHIFYLHTNLTSKKNVVLYNNQKIKRENTLGTIESGGTLFLSCLINCIIVLTFAEVDMKSTDIKDQYSLFTAYEAMKNSFGKISMYIWSFGLLSSGNNSSFMCEYATKSVFEGFLNKKVNVFYRVLFFRLFLFFIVYSFLLYDKYSIDQLTNFINTIQVMLLPMAIVPLYRFSVHKNVLGDFALKKYYKFFVFAIVIFIIFSNLVLTIVDIINNDTSIFTISLLVVFSMIYIYLIILFFNLPITKTYYRNS